MCGSAPESSRDVHLPRGGVVDAQDAVLPVAGAIRPVAGQFVRTIIDYGQASTDLLRSASVAVYASAASWLFVRTIALISISPTYACVWPAAG